MYAAVVAVSLVKKMICWFQSRGRVDSLEKLTPTAVCYGRKLPKLNGSYVEGYLTSWDFLIDTPVHLPPKLMSYLNFSSFDPLELDVYLRPSQKSLTETIEISSDMDVTDESESPSEQAKLESQSSPKDILESKKCHCCVM